MAIDAGHREFMLYKNGVFSSQNCSSVRLDHGVLAVGYGTQDVKNVTMVSTVTVQYKLNVTQYYTVGRPLSCKFFLLFFGSYFYQWCCKVAAVSANSRWNMSKIVNRTSRLSGCPSVVWTIYQL